MLLFCEFQTMELTAFKLPFMLLLMLSMLVRFGAPDAAQDREECGEQLAGLATCLPYVGGEAKAPTPDCCNGLKALLKNSKKCLCVIVRDRNDPDLGLTINSTLALGLPSVCHASANVSECPALLHLAPNSTDAQVFYEFAHTSSNNTASSPTPTAAANSTTGKSNGTSSSDGCSRRKRWQSVEIVAAAFVLFWSFASCSIM